MKKPSVYKGFEQGPIRPPSEAGSLLVRITRNCPWNRCTFCPVYKGSKFSIRPVDHVIQDIDAVHACVSILEETMARDNAGHLNHSHIHEAYEKIDSSIFSAFQSAAQWMLNGMHSIFLQDANSLVIKPADMITILRHLKKRFPNTRRITSYARSHTVARIHDQDLREMAQNGLNRLHIGLESGCDKVLAMVQKGSSKKNHIDAGLKVKKAGIELSEYVMPGLGGQDFSRSHALESADALNQINPDFIRLRTLALPNSLEMFEQWESGEFKKCTEIETAKEILLFLENLDGITGMVKSDHILNLFQEIEGKLPEEKEFMTGIIHTFLGMEPQEQVLYQLGRRAGILYCLEDLEIPHKRRELERLVQRLEVTPDNIDLVISDIMKRFV